MSNYWANPERWKAKARERYRAKKADDPQWFKELLDRQRPRNREWLRAKYASDPEWRAKRKANTIRSQRKNRPAANERNRQYRLRHPEKQIEYRQRPEVKARLIELQRLFRRSEDGRKRWQARSALNEAIRSGKILRPTTCSLCPNPSPQAHHHKGYEPEHWLDVLWLCLPCHRSQEA
jgi:hypothetical protein